MSKGKSKRRLEMGEAAWDEYQKRRSHDKYKRWAAKNKSEIVGNNKRRSNYATYWRMRAKNELIEYKGGCCSKCGYDKRVPGAYDFHHRDPNEKEFSISKYSVLNIGRLKKEVDKCDLVCKNCHAEIHDADRKEIREEAIRNHNEYMKGRKPRGAKDCEHCGESFKQRSIGHRFCSARCRSLDHKEKKTI